MADLIDSETTLEPDDSIKAASPSDAGTSSTREISQRMLDVHAPHESIHTRKSFFIHIATASVGLLTAVGLEQPSKSYTATMNFARHASITSEPGCAGPSYSPCSIQIDRGRKAE
jgi:hypothetical protein